MFECVKKRKYSEQFSTPCIYLLYGSKDRINAGFSVSSITVKCVRSHCKNLSFERHLHLCMYFRKTKKINQDEVLI